MKTESSSSQSPLIEKLGRFAKRSRLQLGGHVHFLSLLGDVKMMEMRSPRMPEPATGLPRSGPCLLEQCSVVDALNRTSGGAHGV